MRVLFNCTTNVKGGPVQNAANFVRHAAADDRIEWWFAISPQVAEVLNAWGEQPPRTAVFDTPARHGKARRALRRLAATTRPDLVYTMSGPAYVRFPCTHVLGMTVPYVTHAGWEGFRTGRSLLGAAGALASAVAKGIIARHGAGFWVFQTETSRAGYARRFRVPSGRSFVIPNAIGREFARHIHAPAEHAQRDRGETKVFFCPAADYPHKNLLIVPEVARHLRDRGFQSFEFVLTLPPEGRTWRRIERQIQREGVRRFVRNMGPFSYSDAPALYARADLVFLPSVLEVFSTSYLEAIALGLPLVVADRPFAREICRDAACYFDPQSPRAGADAIATRVEAAGDVRVKETARASVLSRYGPYDRRFEGTVRMLEAVHGRVARGT